MNDVISDDKVVGIVNNCQRISILNDNMDRLQICRWNFHSYGKSADLTEEVSYIELEKIMAFMWKKHVLIAQTFNLLTIKILMQTDRF